MKRLSILATLGILFSILGAAHGQQLDAAIGVGTVLAPANSISNGFTLPSLKGGAYPVFSADALIHKNFGFGGEIAWRGGQGLYDGTYPYRTLFYDFNGIYAPTLGKKLGAELMAGIGAESTHFYQNSYVCGAFGCTNYTSSNHFMGHFGAGIRYYMFGNFFIRPEAHLYLIHNNAEFSSGYATRVGLSIGYTFRAP